MITLPRVIGVAALAGFLAVSANAQERALERLELTMALLPEDAVDAEVITRRIELPPAAPDAAANSQRPAEPPGQANGQGPGLDTAAEARERGREFGQNVAAQARENRENAGRGDDPPGPPENPPGPPIDVPSPPGNGGPPDNPGRPTP
jgi:hypothetical protein